MVKAPVKVKTDACGSDTVDQLQSLPAVATASPARSRVRNGDTIGTAIQLMVDAKMKLAQQDMEMRRSFAEEARNEAKAQREHEAAMLKMKIELATLKRKKTDKSDD